MTSNVSTDERLMLIPDLVDLSASRAIALLEAGPDMVLMLRRYASECAECHGSGELVHGDGNPENDLAQVCGACEDIRDLIERATPTYLYRTPPPPKPVQEEDDVIF